MKKLPDRASQFRPHPWHGLEIGPEPPGLLYAYVEITPFDLIKYEVDKQSGYFRVDRPQRGSSQSPALYGFIPRTYYFETYKLVPGHSGPVTIERVYGRAHGLKVVEAAIADYAEYFSAAG